MIPGCLQHRFSDIHTHTLWFCRRNTAVGLVASLVRELEVSSWNFLRVFTVLYWQWSGPH